MVFPGGALDPEDAAVPLAGTPCPACRRRLAEGADADTADALAVTAIRELWEETGLRLARPAPWPAPPPGWADFAAGGGRPDGSALTFVFRAITPPGRPRRFDARFFLAPATAVLGNPTELRGAQDELSNLQWVPLADVRRFDMPFITEVILAEVAALIGRRLPPDSVPFFRNDDEETLFQRLRGVSQRPDQ
jgi:8-oxo-dGTP pyrophosphatase MutT (NUDIX family)